MAKTHSISPKEKLRLLQESDHWRTWKSLADERQCVICERMFTGRDVRVTQDHHTPPLLQCPTPGCSAGPREWIHPGNPLTDDVVWQDWQQILADLSEDKPQPKAKRKTTSAKSQKQ
jgi:hypothetical protein